MIWVGNGNGGDGTDTYQIRIWGDNGAIYDNGLDQDIGGGNIIAQTKK